MQVVEYTIPSRGMGTDFAQSEQNREYATKIRNRFINLTGSAERRLGYTSLFPTQVSGFPNLTRLHEYVAKNGDTTILASTDTGVIYRYSSGAWSVARSGLANTRILSIQHDDKMIFYNGVDRNIYTDDGGTTFKDVVARIVAGKCGGASNATTLTDADVTDYTTLFAANNDIVYNYTRNAYGVVTNIATGTITHSTIGTAGRGIGLATGNQSPGDAYVLIDTLANNIIDVGTNVKDNTATAGAGTNATTIAVAGMNFTNSGIKVGDYIVNTTLGALTKVTAVGTNITVVSVTGQTSGDALVFLKDAMPVTKNSHINWGRVYYMDTDNTNTVRISGRDDPFDLTTQSNVLRAGQYDFGGLQPLGDRLLAMTTFQRFFVAAGKRYIYVFSGTDPVADTATSVTSFAPIAVYPQGAIGRFCIGSTGNNLLFISTDGLNNASVGSDNNSLISTNLNSFIKSVVRTAIKNNQDTDNVQLVFYPRRGWIMMKIDSLIYIFNTPALGGANAAGLTDGTWSYFDGAYAEMNHYMVRQNGDLIACGANGGVWLMDNGYTDNGAVITTEFEFPWLSLEEPEKTPRVKKGVYIEPAIESGEGITYTFTATADLDNSVSSSVDIVSQGAGTVGVAQIGATRIGGSGVTNDKYPLRWRGKEVKIRVTTSSTAGPDVLAGFILYGEVGGLR